MLLFSGAGGYFPAWLSSASGVMVVALWALGFSVCSFVFSLITGDYSWVDRLWSTLPVGFVWFYAWRGGFSPVLLVTACLVTVWGLRLSLNFARKGGYTGTEDYRWKVLKGRIGNRFLWQLFNLLFISGFQIGLFVLFTYPVYSMTLSSGTVNLPFLLSLILGVLLIGFETWADQQQWNFHLAKKAAAAGQEYPEKYTGDVARGFLTGGLFSVSRHPNYFGELGFWWSVWLMALSLGGGAVQTGVFGPAALTVLFIGSTIFTESLSTGKYPGYRDYKKRVSPIIPWFPRKGQELK